MQEIQCCRAERGQTILIVAISLLALLAMAALAIDVTTLYVASAEAQRAADAAALAGAKVFVNSGYTSNPSAFTTSNLCNGFDGWADHVAQAAVSKNTVAGSNATLTTSCNFTTQKNPTIAVQVQRTALPIFLARIWGASSPSVSAKATAEAYNPSGGSVPVQVQSVKPWLVANCDPNHNSAPTNPNCGQSEFIDPSTGALINPLQFLGESILLSIRVHTGSPQIGDFYALDIPSSSGASACPYGASSPSYCTGSPGPYYDNVACSNPFPFTCGQPIGPSSGGVTLDLRNNGTPPPNLKARTDEAVQCLIHQPSTGPGQDTFVVQGAGLPTLIRPGPLNPDSSLAGASYISRSDSVVTVPVYDGADLCPLTNCTVNTSVIGFLQLGIQQDNNGAGQFSGVVLNATGCTPSMAGQSITGGGVSSIPVRLVQTP
jgi:hypothetical protein